MRAGAMRGNYLEDNDLLWFAKGFRTVEMWQYAMRAHGYGVPEEVANALRETMEHLHSPFSKAFCLLWDQKKILLGDRALIYAGAAGTLWTPWQLDVLALVPPPDEVLQFESVWRLTVDSSPLDRLQLWHPTDEVERDIRDYLLDFGARVLAAERRKPHA
jgi:hypothetical protein